MALQQKLKKVQMGFINTWMPK